MKDIFGLSEEDLAVEWSEVPQSSVRFILTPTPVALLQEELYPGRVVFYVSRRMSSWRQTTVLGWDGGEHVLLDPHDNPGRIISRRYTPRRMWII